MAEDTQTQGDDAAAPPVPPADPPPAADPEPEPETAGKPNTRAYRVYESIKLPLNVKPADLLKILQGKYGSDGTIDVLVHINKVTADAPKKAVEAVGELKDLDGNYEAVAESALNAFPGVKSETRRTVKFG